MTPPLPGATWRPAWAEVDTGAIRRNVALLHRLAGTALCAVVKADGYGHGALTAATAALEAGATGLAVACVEEGVTLREAGIGAPVLLLSEPPLDAMEAVAASLLTPTLYRPEAVRAFGEAVRRVAGTDGSTGVREVQVKVDTGMHRVGVDPRRVVALFEALAEAGLVAGGLWTHLAVADSDTEADREHTAGQLRLLAEVRAALEGAGQRVPALHAANSAGAIAHRDARLDMVRCGISCYGELPSPGFATAFAAAVDEARVPGARLEPALSLRARVSFVQRLRAGERCSYGLVRPLERDSVVATVPIGYADGVSRRYFPCGGTVLVGGRRRPLAGTVTMDQILVDCGPDDPVAVGDEVVLVGSQGTERLSASDWAATLGTIPYEVLCGIGARVPRVVVERKVDEPSMSVR